MHVKRNTIGILYVCEQFFFCLLISKKLLTGLVFYRRSLSLHMFPWNWFSDWLISCLTKDCKINFSNGNESLCELQKNQQKKVLLDLLDQVFRAEFSKAQPHKSWMPTAEWQLEASYLLPGAGVASIGSSGRHYIFLLNVLPSHDAAFLALMNDAGFLSNTFNLICIRTEVQTQFQKPRSL